MPASTSVVAGLYPPHRRPSGDQCRHCPDPQKLLVCLPSAGLDGVLDRLRPHITATAQLLASGHFPLWRRHDPTEAGRLVDVVSDPGTPPRTRCAGGPIDLLDLAATEAHHRASTTRQAQDLTAIVAGTPTALPWSYFLDAHNADPDHYPLAEAITQFETQPRIAALAAVGTSFGSDDYGPGLEALQTGTGAYAGYRAGVAVFADGLLTLDGELLIPSFSPLLVEQTLEERQAFHDTARRYLAAIHPATVLVAVRCLRYPTW
jgi:hypothetical protein